MSPHTRPAVFLDRDGTVSEEVGYMKDPDMFSVFPWTSRAIRRINDSGMATVLVTNQSAVGRGMIDSGLVDRVHDMFRDELRREGARLDGVYYCPHHPDDGCECRKPRPGLIESAQEDLNLELSRSYMVGDRYTDILAGQSAGASTILVLTGAGMRQRDDNRKAPVQPDHIVPTLDDAVRLILGMQITER